MKTETHGEGDLMLKPKIQRAQAHDDLSASSRVSTGEILGKYQHLVKTNSAELIYQVLSANQRLSPPHYHTKAEEGIYVLAGTVTIWQDGDDLVNLHKGDYIHFDPLTPHFGYNSAEEIAEMILLRIPATGDETHYLPDIFWDGLAAQKQARKGG